MAQFASDAFTNTPATSLTTHSAAWTRHTSYTVDSQISDANRARASATGTSAYWHSGAPATADYSVSADLFFKETSGGAAFVGVIGRVDTAANTLYMARYGGDVTDAWQLYKFVAGAATLFAGSVGATITDETSHNIKLEMVGSAIKLFKDGEGTAAISVTDTAITAAGKAGIRFLDSSSDTLGIHIDNFSADDIGAGLILANIAHGHTLDAVTLTQTHNLAQADAAHGHALDAINLTQAHNLTQADVLHGHTLDNVVLNVDVTLALADINHGHTVEAVTLTQIHSLAQADVAHAHLVDAVSLTQAHNLAQADVTHGHTVEEVTLVVGGVNLALDIVLHAHTLDNITFTQAHSLGVADVSHGHALDNVIFSIDGALIAAPDIIFTVPSERRIFSVASERRIFNS